MSLHLCWRPGDKHLLGMSYNRSSFHSVSVARTSVDPKYLLNISSYSWGETAAGTAGGEENKSSMYLKRLATSLIVGLEANFGRQSWETRTVFGEDVLSGVSMLVEGGVSSV